MLNSPPTFAAVTQNDFEAMAELRIEALQESLDRLGRFDPIRARERLAAGFVPQYMQHIELDAERIGFITLRPISVTKTQTIHLDHLYIRPEYQGRKVGEWALNWAKSVAKNQRSDITLSALKQSAANRFYLRHGFVMVGESEFDVDYRWSVNGGASA